MMAEIRRVAVLGCGLMGSGIAEVAARAGYETWVREINEDQAEHGRNNIRKSLDRAVDRGKLEAAVRDETIGRIHLTTSLDALAESDIVIEAVVENIELKNELFGKLDRVCGPDTIFA